jgi:hypothetical protein
MESYDDYIVFKPFVRGVLPGRGSAGSVGCYESTDALRVEVRDGYRECWEYWVLEVDHVRRWKATA